MTNSPPRYKMALLTWAAAYPLMTALSVLLHPVLDVLPLPGKTLVLTGLLITTMTYVIMPRLTRLLANWLVPAGIAEDPDEKLAIAESLADVRGCLSG